MPNILNEKFIEIDGEIKPGDKVKMKQNRQVGILKEIRGKKAIVQLGMVPITVNLHDLVLVKDKKTDDGGAWYNLFSSKNLTGKAFTSAAKISGIFFWQIGFNTIILHPERWQSGRLRRSWKPLTVTGPGVRIPLSPPPPTEALAKVGSERVIRN